MENFIQKKKLIEFGEYKGCLYGTSKDSITRAMKIGKTCVLKVQPEVSFKFHGTISSLNSFRLEIETREPSASQKRAYLRELKQARF